MHSTVANWVGRASTAFLMGLGFWLILGAGVFGGGDAAIALNVGRTPHSVSMGEAGAVPSWAIPAREPSEDLQSKYPWLEGNAVVEMKFTSGRPFKVDVLGAYAPITAGNFIDLVNRGIYDSVEIIPDKPFLLRILADNYVDPQTDQVREIPLEIQPENSSKISYGLTFYNQFISENPLLRNGYRGAIALAHTEGVPNDGSAQLIVSYGNPGFIPFDGNDLDGNYAVFAYIQDESIDYYEPSNDVMEQIYPGDKLEYVRVISGMDQMHYPEELGH